MLGHAFNKTRTNDLIFGFNRSQESRKPAKIMKELDLKYNDGWIHQSLISNDSIKIERAKKEEL